ncbi:peptidoglycan DD-metalloendopeptidase family protein [Tumebacillus sp. DT12]|uniref:Peptidoglycan DD-metalloendopeptidase family protein n=1 Tax=Tumebacillus lacus TaxID=2995335 RepID=A0ABT3X5D7_9BACL|nr:M23 family metallopeptidase [Tumebacillus lacus]MCX7571072.1 peptidoglycan DD-metalloendopeptidase family protein [Tumebacillus lacus]
MQDRKSRSSKSWKMGLAAALVLTLAVPTTAGANIESLKQQQQQKEQELQQAREREKIARQKKEQYQQQIDLNAVEINKMLAEISAKELEIQRLQGNIFQKNQEIDQAGQELEAAQKRVEERDKLLKQRLRMMYEQGEVQYLEVLLSSTSFTDFLDRFEALQVIFEQDNVILRKNKEDREKVALLKQDLETQQQTLVAMKGEQESQKGQLDAMKEQKVALNEKLEGNKAEQERIEAEMEAQQEAAIAAIFNVRKQIDAERYKQNQPNPSKPLTGNWAWPVPASMNITSEFGDRIDPFTGVRTGHNGMDIAAATGTQVVAAQAGTVITAGWVNGFGNCIIIDHGGNLWSLYGHLVNGGINVSEGQQVVKGAPIGKVGSTGRSTGPHLHFGVYLNGQVVSPRNYL